MLLKNPLLVSALSAMIISQLAKLMLILFTEHRLAPERMTGTGGMPSAHSATVAALCISTLLHHGSGSPHFAISLIFGIIVVYDATGIRRAAGHHAEILNELLKEFSHLFDEKARPKALKTLLGHTYPQVLVGLGIGITTGAVVTRLMKQ